MKGRFEAALVDATLELKIGLPQLDDTQVGPVISREQQTRLAALTAAGRSAGGRLLCGGKAPKGFDHGCWFEPTLIADPDPASVLVQEESFGPIAVVLGARNFDQALALCNNVQHGLVATIFSGNTAVQQRFPFLNRFRPALLPSTAHHYRSIQPHRLAAGGVQVSAHLSMDAGTGSSTPSPRLCMGPSPLTTDTTNARYSATAWPCSELRLC